MNNIINSVHNLHITQTIPTPVTLLIQSIREGNLQEAEKIINNNTIDLNTSFCDGILPLELALKKFNWDTGITRFLLAKGAKISAVPNLAQLVSQIAWILSIAIEKKDLDIIKLLFEPGVSINKNLLLEESKEYGITVFKIAILIDNLEILEYFIKNAEGIVHAYDCVDDKPYSHIAITETNNIEVIKLFITYGIDINAKDKNGKSLLHVALDKVKLDVVKLLIDHKAAIQVSDISLCQSAIMTANIDIIKLFIEHGMDVNASDDSGTPLIFTALNTNDCKVIELLLTKVADINSKDCFGISLFETAIKTKNKEIIHLFKEKN